MKHRKNILGLTLTELLVVISIIVILASIAIIFLRSQVFKGKDAKRIGDIHRIGAAVEEYEKDFDCYPLPSLVVCDPGAGLKPYLSKIPCDPTTKASYFYGHEDDACPDWYRFYSKLENVAGSCGPNGDFNFYLGSANAPLDSGCPPGESGGSSNGNGNGSNGNGNGNGDGGDGDEAFYGCFSGVCLPISWDDGRPGPECDPNFGSSSCYGQCTGSGGQPQNECESWN